GVGLKIERSLPIAGGLGSSAAASVGGAFAAAHLVGRDGDHNAMVTAALAGEARVAGHHLDNIAPSLFGGLCLVQRVNPVSVAPIPIAGDWWITVVTPDLELPTA